MSLAVVVHAGRYVLSAADCLEYRSADGETITPIATDVRRPKIHHAPIGIVSGTGVSAMVASVAASQPVDAGELLDAILTERAKAATWPAALREHALTATGFLCTAMVGPRRVAALVYHPHFDSEAVLDVLPGRTLAFMRDASYEAYADWLESSVRLCAADEDLDASIAYHADLVRTLITRYAREPNPRSSVECSISVHLDNDVRLISPILHVGDALTWTGHDFNGAQDPERNVA